MQCPCGSETVDREVTKDYEVIGEFKECKSCGRILWIKQPEEVIETNGV